MPRKLLTPLLTALAAGMHQQPCYILLRKTHLGTIYTDKTIPAAADGGTVESIVGIRSFIEDIQIARMKGQS